ncbi:molecular chaperone [Planctomyces sp. SH-PL62]|uniref:TorD/DmsD family molecular chaperone n=1 Tax=Planctomyces sp. SH-PL62 TaxID=1636152 RepID=UPI00078D653A|nr:molecular chaperone TorD family protein [Planctomyces sp. SH-PL62]AMV38349.1 Chaperone protein TorD [Planctomyces sp. SH-PL62]
MCDQCRCDADTFDTLRERIYDFLAAILTHPDLGTWGRVTNPSEQARDVAAVDVLRSAASPASGKPSEPLETDDLDLRPLMVELCQPLGRLRADYDRFFVKSRRISHSALEMDHKSAWLRRRPDRSIDELSREYDAAGLPAREDSPSRCDHVARELGFMAWLIAQSRFQRRVACLGAGRGDEVRGCDLAQRDFFGHHLAGWLPELAAQLRDYEGGGCLEQLGRFLAAWIVLERRYLDAEPRFVGVTPSPRGTKAAGSRKGRPEPVSV